MITPSLRAELADPARDYAALARELLERCIGQPGVVSNSRSGETERRAGLLRAELRYGRIEDILERGGLHAYLTEFLDASMILKERASAKISCSV